MLIKIPCTHCHSEMVLTRALPDVSIRCSGCGFITEPVETNDAKVTSDPGARWSLWLGLSSVVLLFITGLPALFLGVRSLLRMKHYEPLKFDRNAAIAGTVLGTIFGVIIGAFAAFVLFVFAITLTTVERTEDPDEVLRNLATFAKLDVPSKLLPTGARNILQTRDVTFRDHKNGRSATISLEIGYIRSTFGPNTNQLKTTLQNHDFGVDLQRVPSTTSNLTWKLAGKETTVKKTTMVEEKPDMNGVTRKVTRYFGMVTTNQGTYGMVVLLREPNNPLTEADVKKIFESTQAVEP